MRTKELRGFIHRFRPEIQEIAPSLFPRVAPVVGIQAFPAIKITVVHQVHYVLRSELEGKHA